MRVWLVAEFDWDLFRDEPRSAELMLPDKAFLTPEAAMAQAQAQVDARDAEGPQRMEWGPEEKIGPLRWAMVDDYWIATIDEDTGWHFRVYSVEVQG